MPPALLTGIAFVALASGAASAIAILADILSGHRQHMWIMTIVWPVTALWSGPLAYLAYRRYGRAGTHRAMMEAKRRGEEPPSRQQSFPVLAGKGTTHCGAGCTLGDIVAEWFAVLVPLSIFGHRLFGTWVYSYVAAYALGIVFQYFTIQPMRNLSVKDGIVAAIKANTLSLTAWQVGMRARSICA